MENAYRLLEETTKQKSFLITSFPRCHLIQVVLLLKDTLINTTFKPKYYSCSISHHIETQYNIQITKLEHRLCKVFNEFDFEYYLNYVRIPKSAVNETLYM